MSTHSRWRILTHSSLFLRRGKSCERLEVWYVSFFYGVDGLERIFFSKIELSLSQLAEINLPGTTSWGVSSRKWICTAQLRMTSYTLCEKMEFFFSLYQLSACYIILWQITLPYFKSNDQTFSVPSTMGVPYGCSAAFI